MINKEARIIYDKLLLGEQTPFSIKLTGEKLKEMQKKGLLEISWVSKYGDFGSKGKGYQVNFSTYYLLPVIVTASIINRFNPDIVGKLSVKVPVVNPSDLFWLKIKPNKVIAGEFIRAEVVIPDKYIGSYKFHYKWQGEKCKVENLNRSNAVVTAPKTGEASVLVSISAEDENGKNIFILFSKISFSVDENISRDSPPESKDKSTQDKNNTTVTVPQDEGLETGEGSGNQEAQGGSDKDNKTPESIKKPEKEDVPEDDGTATVLPNEGVESTSSSNKPLGFSGSTPNIWEGGNSDEGFFFRRKNATATFVDIKKDAKYSAIVRGEIWGKINDHFAPENKGELLKDLK